MKTSPARRRAIGVSVSCTESLESRRLLSASPVVLRINAGGEAYTDSLARPFEADTGFTGGTPAQTTATVAGTDDPTLFQTWREGTAFSFRQAVANGNYALWLEFADFASTALGERTMDVSAEGRQVLDDYDIFAAAGTGVATAKYFDVNISDGALDLAFTGVAGEAMVSAIVLIPTDVPPGMHLHSGQGEAADMARLIASASNLRQIGQSILMYAQDNKGLYPADLGQLFAAQPWWDYTIFANPRTSTALPRGETSFVEQLAWVRDHDDYLYRPGLRSSSPPTEVLAYENPARMPGLVNVLFNDGHVEWLDRSDAAQRIGFDPDVAVDPVPVWPQSGTDPAVYLSQHHLYAMAQGLQYYAQDHLRLGGIYPQMLSALHTDGRVPLATFANPRGTTPVPDLTGDAAAAWIDACHDYVYLGAGMKVSDAPDMVVLYENPSPMAVGINLLFNSGRVEFREMRWAVETLSRAHAGYGSAALHSPVANIAGYYLTQQGVPVQVTGAGVRALQSTPIYTRTVLPIAAYEWDFDYDGTNFDVDATGQSATIPADRLQAVGKRTIALRVRDTVGHISDAATTSLTVTTMPAVTAISDDTGHSTTDAITSDRTLLISGVSEPLAAITVYRDGEVAGTTSADSAGVWTLDSTGTVLADGVYTFTVAADNPSGGTVTSDPFVVHVDTAVPTLTSWSVNGGAMQRSMVRRLDVVFSEPVRASAGSFLVKLSNGQYVANLSVEVANPSADGMNWVITFSGPAATGGSLPDGIYDLAVGGAQDFAGNRIVPVYAMRFHRLFGDSDGNKIVNALDYARLKNSFARSASDPLFNSAFDYEGNGLINALDLARFRQRYGLIYSY